LYSDTDRTTQGQGEVLFFPAGIYRINAALKIPPYAHLVGEGPDKTIIRIQATTQWHGHRGRRRQRVGQHRKLRCHNTNTDTDFKHHVQGTQSAYGGVSLDNATKAYFNNCQVPRHVRLRWSGRIKFKRCDGEINNGTTLHHDIIVFNQCQFTNSRDWWT
jgi:hypothetical protein